METLLSNLRKDLTTIGIKQKELAKEWGISPSGVSDVFKLKREMSFYFLIKCLIRLKKIYSENKQSEIILQYLLQSKPENRREALEIFYQMGKFDLLKLVIDMEKDSNTPENREWANVFELIHKRFTEPFETESYYKALKKKMQIVKTLEMKIVLELSMIHTLYQTGNYVLIASQLKRISDEIRHISNKYIKRSLEIRLKEATLVILLQRGKIEDSRNLCNDIFEIFQKDPIFKVPYTSALFKMGESYVFEDYEKSKEFLEKTILFLSNEFHLEMVRKKKIAEYTLAFLKVHYECELDSLNSQAIHPAELAYLKIKQNQKIEAVRILNNLLFTNNSLSGIQTFYLGLALTSVALI